jgi:hypothetical protein
MPDVSGKRKLVRSNSLKRNTETAPRVSIDRKVQLNTMRAA